MTYSYYGLGGGKGFLAEAMSEHPVFYDTSYVTRDETQSKKDSPLHLRAQEGIDELQEELRLTKKNLRGVCNTMSCYRRMKAYIPDYLEDEKETYKARIIKLNRRLLHLK